MTEYYECSECYVKLKVVTKDVKCSVYTSKSKHNHSAKTTARKRHGIDHEIKEEIKRLEASGNAPRAIKWKQREMGHVAPNINQIYKFLNTIRVAKVDSDTLRWSLEDVLEFAKKREKISEDEDELFVASVTATALPVAHFRLFLTTKRLIRLAQKSTHIMSDATYNFVTEKCLCMTIGNAVNHFKIIQIKYINKIKFLTTFNKNMVFSNNNK